MLMGLVSSLLGRLKKVFSLLFTKEQWSYLITWLMTLILFYLILFAVNFDFSTSSDVYMAVFGIDILVGGIAFLFLFGNAVPKLFKKESFKNSAGVLGTLGVFAFLFFYMLIKLPNTKAYQLAAESKKTPTQQATQQINTPSPQATIKPTVTPKPTQKPPSDGKIDCKMTVQCGGNTVRMTSWECSQSTCCQIGDHWVFYKDKSQCVKDQEAYNKSKQVNSPTYTYTTPSYPPCIVYYPVLNKTETYNYISPSECLTWQNRANSTTQVFSQPSPYTITSYPSPTPYVPQMTKAQCSSAVRDKYYSTMVVQYGCAFPCPEEGACGSSSVCDALWSKVVSEMNACNQYP